MENEQNKNLIRQKEIEEEEKIRAEAKAKVEKEIKARKETENQKKIGIGCLIFLGIIVFIVILISLGGNKGVKEQPTEKLNLSITFGMEKYIDPSLFIENKNSFEWEDCKIKINDKFERTIPRISSAEDAVKEFRMADFIDKSGLRFDSMLYKIDTVLVRCNQPHYSIEIYQFK